MPIKSTKERLMAYPKEVIIDYLLKDYLPIWQIDFRKLEFRKHQARTAKLLEEWKQIEPILKSLDVHTDKGRAEYWRLQGRISQIMEEVDRLSEKTTKLLGIKDSDAA